MGLDMYLQAKKYVEKVDFRKLQSSDNLSYDSPEVINPLWKDIVDTAQMSNAATDIYGVNVEVTCAYWRKANMIHKWFVDNVQNGEDDCGNYYVSQNKLMELLTLCRQALFTKDSTLLPPQGGFFFGNTDIDEWYWHGIKNTIKQLKRVSELPDFNDLSFYYQSSW